jgi:hypothetical protein
MNDNQLTKIKRLIVSPAPTSCHHQAIGLLLFCHRQVIYLPYLAPSGG